MKLDFQPPIVVALEGLDGAGKSTLAAQLAADSNLDIEVVHTPIKDVKALAMQLRGVNVEASFLAFMVGNATASTSNPRVLVFDRYVLSTIAHHWSVFQRFEENVPGLMRVLGVRPADITIFLDVAPTVATARISARTDDSNLVLSLEDQRQRFAWAMNSPIARSLTGEIIVLANENLDQLRSTLNLIRSRIQELSSTV